MLYTRLAITCLVNGERSAQMLFIFSVNGEYLGLEQNSKFEPKSHKTGLKQVLGS
jgi:hypothetical protein